MVCGVLFHMDARILRFNGWYEKKYVFFNDGRSVHSPGTRLDIIAFIYRKYKLEDILCIQIFLLVLLVKEPNTKKCNIKRDNLCVTGPYETMSRFDP